MQRKFILAMLSNRPLLQGLKVYGHAFPNHHFIDIGTPNELAEAYQKYATSSATRYHLEGITL